MAAHTDASSSAHSEGAGPGSRGRVLLVDDEAMVARVIARLLERSGFSVTLHLHPSEALDRVRAAPQDFDVMVTDMTMPGMSGVELARGVSAAGATMPVVLLSGWIDAQSEKDARAAGIATLLAKPIQMADLVEAVAALVPKTAH